MSKVRRRVDLPIIPRLPKVEMNASALIANAMYLWKLPCGEIRPVWLDRQGKGLDEWNDNWPFEDNLAGELFGPVSLGV